VKTAMKPAGGGQPRLLQSIRSQHRTSEANRICGVALERRRSFVAATPSTYGLDAGEKIHVEAPVVPESLEASRPPEANQIVFPFAAAPSNNWFTLCTAIRRVHAGPSGSISQDFP